jgi:hypothetical protein
MDFLINCACGKTVTVTEAAAGGTIPCPCGRALSVPALKELRLQAGLPPYNISPEAEIEYLLPAGRLPGTKTCVCCGSQTDDSVQILTECEKTWVRGSGGFSWATLLVTWLFFPIALFYREPREEREYGRDKIYSLPLPICRECQPTLRGRKTIKKCLHKIQPYSRLLEKFPDATLTVQQHQAL